ncbi:MAG: AGE family epimerase/isomerase [Clostridia bacterium]|nr:AGE family epimerase/isomerase [Clostridia bacterium]
MNYKEQLKNNVLPFWIKHGIDRKNGGIFTCVDEKGELYGTDKSVWFQGRALWTFSKAYNTVERNPEYLEAAKSIYAFLNRCSDADGRMYFTVTEDGRGIQKRRYYFSETFAAIGCAEYYRASGERETLLAARKYFDIAYECFTGVRLNEPKFNRDTYDYKALSPVMIMLSTAQTMRAVDVEQKDRYARIAKECLDEILHGGFLTDHALLETYPRTDSWSIRRREESSIRGIRWKPRGSSCWRGFLRTIGKRSLWVKRSLISPCLSDGIGSTAGSLRLPMRWGSLPFSWNGI